MEFSNHYVVKSLSRNSRPFCRIGGEFGILSILSAFRSAAVAISTGAFALLLCAALPAAGQGQSTPMPFSGTPIAVPGTFEAENFDLGGSIDSLTDNSVVAGVNQPLSVGRPYSKQLVA